VGLEDNEYSKAQKELEQEVALAGSALNGRYAEELEAILPRKEQWLSRKGGMGSLGLRDELVYRKGMLWISDNKNLIQKILESEHNIKVTGHMVQDETIELIHCSFWWPKMDERIIDFVRSCTECECNKTARH
jgi:hypothetical protein